MRITQARTAAIFFAAVVLFYFYSESVLREVALGKLASSQLGVETILARLPQGFRHHVRARINYAQAREAVSQASTPSAKASAMCYLATLEKRTSAKEQLYLRVISVHPGVAESAPAYQYFLLRDHSNWVSSGDYHEFIARCPVERRLDLWLSGIMELEQKDVSPEEQKIFLLPLFEIKPDCRDYEMLYRRLARVAEETNDIRIRDDAEKRAEECLDLPTQEQLLMAREKAEKAKAKADKEKKP